MGAYESATRRIVNRFIRHELSFPDCLAALDAALAELKPRLTDAQLPVLRALMLTTNARVMNELEARGAPQDSSALRAIVGTKHVEVRMRWKTTKLMDFQKETLRLNNMETCSAGARKNLCKSAAEYRCSGAESGIVIYEQHYCELHKDEHERGLGPRAKISS